jgi:type 1 glutamine amidotransferase
MKKRALIVQGGWWGHYPADVAEIFRGILEEEGLEAEVSGTLDAWIDLEKLRGLDLIVPLWTMGKGTEDNEEGIPIDLPQIANVVQAVAGGVGLAGCHGGMCDTFHGSWKWNFMTGGKYLDHPGKVKVGEPGTHYTVNIRKGSSPIVAGIEDFAILSEQYYMLVDPVNEVLATTRFPAAPGPYVTNGVVDMPVIWTRRWGEGKVFYCSIGHDPDIIRNTPEVMTVMRRGFLWAAGCPIPRD